MAVCKIYLTFPTYKCLFSCSPCLTGSRIESFQHSWVDILVIYNEMCRLRIPAFVVEHRVRRTLQRALIGINMIYRNLVIIRNS